MQANVNIEDLVEGSDKAAERGALITANYRGGLFSAAYFYVGENGLVAGRFFSVKL